MFTQLFGSYLLNKKLVTLDQLVNALDFQKTVRLKLGVLAVNSGFMSAEEVNTVHNAQAKADKKFGELAIEMGFLDEDKLSKLLSTQKSGYLMLGQAMVDLKYMTLEKFEEALNNYKRDHSLTNEQFKSLQNGEIEDVVKTLYSFNGASQSDIYIKYISLLMRNIIRFIDDDFRPLDAIPVKNYKYEWLASQEISGEVQFYTGISADEKSFINFAGKHAEDEYTVNNEYVKASVGEFLNLVNGLFIVNMSNEDMELELTPQAVDSDKSLTGLYEAFYIPVNFSFGRVDFIISKTSPTVI